MHEDISGRVPEECGACRLPFLEFQTDFVNHAGDRLCQWCRAVFWTATVLIEEGIQDEETIFPTLAFAKYATGTPEYNDFIGKTEDATGHDIAEVLLSAGRISTRTMERGYLGWDFVREVEGVPFIRVLPFTVFAEKHPGTQNLKQIRIQILSKNAKEKEVRKDYERILLEQGIQWDDSASGCVSHNFWGSYLDIRVRPADALIYKETAIDTELLERHKDYFLRKAYPASFPTETPDDFPYTYPPPRYIEALCKGLRGPQRARNTPAASHGLDLYGKPNEKTAIKSIPAFVAWHLGAAVAPETGRPRIAQTLNKHLLDPSGLDHLPEDLWRRDDTVWRDAEELDQRFQRLRSAFNNKPLPPPVISRAKT